MFKDNILKYLEKNKKNSESKRPSKLKIANKICSKLKHKFVVYYILKKHLYFFVVCCLSTNNIVIIKYYKKQHQPFFCFWDDINNLFDTFYRFAGWTYVDDSGTPEESLSKALHYRRHSSCEHDRLRTEQHNDILMGKLIFQNAWCIKNVLSLALLIIENGMTSIW